MFCKSFCSSFQIMTGFILVCSGTYSGDFIMLSFVRIFIKIVLSAPWWKWQNFKYIYIYIYGILSFSPWSQKKHKKKRLNDRIPYKSNMEKNKYWQYIIFYVGLIWNYKYMFFFLFSFFFYLHKLYIWVIVTIFVA